MNNAQNEINIQLASGQTALIFSPRDIVNDLIADLIVGYYPGEDQPGGYPYKIALAPSLQTLFEVSLSEGQFVEMLRHLTTWFKKRTILPHAVSDQVQQL